MRNLFFLLLILPLTSCGKSELNWLILSPNNIEGLTNLKFLLSGLTTTIYISVISIIMVGAIFHVKGAQSITGDKGIEFDLILLAVALVIIVAGPGRMSLSQIVKKIPRCLH